MSIKIYNLPWLMISDCQYRSRKIVQKFCDGSVIAAGGQDVDMAHQYVPVADRERRHFVVNALLPRHPEKFSNM